MPSRYEDHDDRFGNLRRDVRAEVRTLVMIPGTFLLIAAILSLLTALGLIVFFGIMLIVDPPRNRPDDFVAVAIIFGGCMVTAVLKIIIIGAIQMIRMRTYPLALTAAILQMIPLCSMCWVLELPVGVWALVILVLPDVREAFYAPDC